MHLVEDVVDLKKKGVKLNPTKATLAFTKATMMSLLYMVLRNLTGVVRNQKCNIDNIKLMAARISILEDPLVLELASDSMTNYPSKEFEDVTDEEGAS